MSPSNNLNFGFWVMRSHQIIGRQQGELPNLVEFGAAPDLQSTPRGTNGSSHIEGEGTTD
jgi:hypothetical protein